MRHFVRLFPARMEALNDVTGFVEEVGAAAAFERHDSLRLTLVLVVGASG
jgi:hypothetical protein